MIGLTRLAFLSAWNRRGTLLLTVASIALSTFMLAGIERIRTDLRDSFSSAVSGTDLIVGPRGGSIQLLLYSVFHLGAPTQSMSWKSVEAIRALPSVGWVVPISLGDSHRGFPVIGTTTGYFEYFRYGDRQPLRLTRGAVFSELFHAVVGAEVAASLGYGVGERITLSHGDGAIDRGEHADRPFTISGVLARTGTPVDRAVLVSLEAIEALHVDWLGGVPAPGRRTPAASLNPEQLQPVAVTAAFVGLSRRAAVFGVQRRINESGAEPLSAILPGVALDELWEVLRVGERALVLMSALVALVSLAGLVSVVLAGLNERRREIAVLRATGAGPRHIVALLAIEGGLVTVAGVGAGVLSFAIAAAALAPWLQSSFGITLRVGEPTGSQALMIIALLAAGWLASLVPGWRAYRMSLADGLSPR
jgi:putative ABC transport system permease protein